MNAPALRPRTVPELVDASVQLLRRHFIQLATICAVFIIPLILVQARYGRALGTPFVPTVGPGGAAGVPRLPGLSPGYLMLVAVGALAWLGSKAGVTIGISDTYVSGRVDIGKAVRQALTRFPVLLIGGILQFSIVMTGTFAFMMVLFIPVVGIAAALGSSPATTGILSFLMIIVVMVAFVAIYSRLFAVPMVILIERAGPVAALKRSVALTKGSTLRVIGVLLLTYAILAAFYLLIILVAFQFVGGLAGLRSGSPVIQVAGDLVGVVLYPITTVFVTLMYYDLRIRKEGLDLELMAQSLDGGVSPTSSGGVTPGDAATPGSVVAPTPPQGVVR